MPPFTVDGLKETLETFSILDLRLLQDFIAAKLAAENVPAPPSEEEVRRILFERGVLTHLPKRPADLTDYQNNTPVAITGEPLSETILRERR